jgi:hypothetical protein
VGFVHQADECGLGLVIPGRGNCSATSILGRSDDDKILIFEFRKNSLPT